MGVGVKRVVGLIGAGVVLAGVLAGCSGDGGRAEACERGYAALERYSAASSASTGSEAGLGQLLAIGGEAAADLRASGATGEVAEAHAAAADALDEFVRTARNLVNNQGSQGAFDAAQVKLLDAGSRMDAACR